MHTVFKISTQILFQDVHFMTQDLFATKSLSEPILTDQHSDHSSRLGGENWANFYLPPNFRVKMKPLPRSLLAIFEHPLDSQGDVPFFAGAQFFFKAKLA